MSKIVIDELKGNMLVGTRRRRMFWRQVNIGTESSLKVPKIVKMTAYCIPEKIHTTAVNIEVNCTGVNGSIKNPSMPQSPMPRHDLSRCRCD